MRKFPYFVCAVAVVFGITAAISFAYAQEAKAPNVIFRKVEDVLTQKQMEAAGIAAGKYIAVYPTQLSDPITKDGQYIIANQFGPETTKKAEKGEPVPYYLTGQYLKDNPNLLVPIVKPSSAPTASAVTVQKPTAPAEPAKIPTPFGTIVPNIGKNGKPIKNQFVIKYLVPDPTNPGKFITMTSGIITKDTDVELPDGETEEWLPGKKYYFDENEHKLYYPRVEIRVPLEENGKTFERIEITTYMPDGMGGVMPRDAAREDTRIKDRTKSPATAPVKIERTKPTEPEKADYEVPSPLYEGLQKIMNFGKKKPAADSVPTSPEASTDATADPKLPKGRQPRKSKESADPVTPPVTMPVKDAMEDVPGVSASPAPKVTSFPAASPSVPVAASMKLSSDEIKAGYKEEGFSVKKLGSTYEVGVSFCPDGALACGPIKKGSGATFEEAKKNAMDAAKAAYDAQFPASKNQLIMPGGTKK